MSSTEPGSDPKTIRLAPSSTQYIPNPSQPSKFAIYRWAEDMRMYRWERDQMVRNQYASSFPCRTMQTSRSHSDHHAWALSYLKRLVLFESHRAISSEFSHLKFSRLMVVVQARINKFIHGNHSTWPCEPCEGPGDRLRRKGSCITIGI